MGQLTGQVALVTGAVRRGGIGRAIVRALADAGAAVVMNDYDRDDDANEMLEILRGEAKPAFLALGDITEAATCRAIVEATVEQAGRIDILVNNAGFAKWQDVGEITEADWDHSLALHLKAPFFLAQAASRHMLAQGSGRIINISSEQAYIGHEKLAHYTAAKAGLRTLSKTLAWALAPNINVNSVCPGPTATAKFMTGQEYAAGLPDSIPLRRWGKPEDVAYSVLFLAGPGGDAYTGQTLDPNVGAVMD